MSSEVTNRAEDRSTIDEENVDSNGNTSAEKTPTDSSFSIASPMDVASYPKAGPRKRQGRMNAENVIATDTPVKLAIEERKRKSRPTSEVDSAKRLSYKRRLLEKETEDSDVGDLADLHLASSDEYEEEEDCDDGPLELNNFDKNLKILRGETVPEPSKLELNNLNALSVLVACQQEQANKWSKAINSEDLWHKFIVNNAADGTRELILRSIMNCFAPKEFVIIVIGVDGPDLCFLSRNCGEVILQLCSSNMTVVYGSGYLTLRVLLRFAYCSEMKLSALSFITDALGKRWDPIKKHLDLSDFHKDPDIVDNIFCPLSFSHLFTMVMSALQQPSTEIQSVSLANNNLVNLQCLSQLKNIGKEVVKLDLSNNLIRELDEIKHLNTLGLKELRLDKNPLCEQYGNEYSYIKAIFQMLPSIMKLDGIDLPGQGLPRHKKNFIVSPDDISLADQFVEYYFTHYDDDRRALKGIYHEKAHFSISASYIHGQKTTVSSMRMSDYTMQSRNLLMISDYSRHVKLLHQGPMAIIDAICKLPKSEHDPYSLKVDLVHSASGVVISVSGVFKEMKNITPIILSFYRVFVLLRTSPVTFQISNEMLCITNPTVMQSMEAFKIPRPPKRKTRDENEGDVKKKYMTDMLCELSSMNRKWSRKCLEETKWDMKEALNSFISLYKISKIPDEAFMKEDQKKSHSFI